jgi:RNA polymerase sigma factor (sigma-70 family)
MEVKQLSRSSKRELSVEEESGLTGVDKLDSSSLHKKGWVLTQEAFDDFLGWLDTDRERAGKKYEEIRRKLIKVFVCRGCTVAEELADETINRVAKKVPTLKDNYVGDPTNYFYGVAHNVHLEYLRKKREAANAAPPPSPEPYDESELEYQCLEHCMEKLPPENRTLILQYYNEEKRAKIDYRKKLAERLGIELNALRIRAYRIRAELYECIRECLRHNEAV